MRKATIPLVLCSLLALTPLLGCYKVQARAELKKGNKFYKDENYKAALEQFQKGLQIDPSVTFAWRSVGLTAMALFKPGVTTPENMKYADIATDAFKRYLQDHPQDTKVQEYLVGVWVNADKFDQAIAYLKQARQEHPENAKLNQAIVSVMIKAGRFQDAMDWVNEHSRNDAQAYYNIGTQAWSKSYNDPTFKYEDRVKAVDIGLQALQRAVDIKPDYMEAMVYTGLLYREKSKVELDPKQKDQWLAKANEWRDKALALRERQKAASARLAPTTSTR